MILDPPLAARHLPWLPAILWLAILPHVQRLPIGVTSLAIVVTLWWITRAQRGEATLGVSKWVKLTFLIAFLSVAVITTGRIMGRDVGITVLSAMLFMKLMELHHRRDVMWVLLIGYFLITVSFIFSQSLWNVGYLLLVAGGLTAFLILLSHPQGHINARTALRIAGVMLAQGIPVMLILFILFPRVPGPLWGLPKDAFSGSGRTGMSDEMTPGAISKLAESDAVAFRVTFEDAIPPPEQRYWRGPVLWHFSGQSWRAPTMDGIKDTPTVRFAGPGLTYTQIVEPHDRYWLFPLEMPTFAPPETRLQADFQLLSLKPVSSKQAHRLVSRPAYRFNETLPPSLREATLQLPWRGNGKSRELATEIRAGAETPRQVVERALTWFRTQGFRYTLHPQPLTGETVDGFLFGTREGFCEHYSGAFTFLMRAAGVPARVVLGYLGGEMNPHGEHMTVLQSDAHAWSEVWLPGEGWMRVDPTAAVAPQRVERSLPRLAGEAGGRMDLAWLRAMREWWDWVDSGWDRWVLGYGPEQQRKLLETLGMVKPTWEAMATWLISLVMALVAAMGLVMVWRLRPSPPDPVRAAYGRYCQRLARVGLARQPWEGPLDYARRVTAARPDLAGAVWEITGLYEQLRYGKGAAPDGLSRLQARVGAFRPGKEQGEVSHGIDQ